MGIERPPFQIATAASLSEPGSQRSEAQLAVAKLRPLIFAMRDRLRSIELSRFWWIRNFFFRLKKRLRFSADGAWPIFEIPPEYLSILAVDDAYASWMVQNEPHAGELNRMRSTAAHLAQTPLIGLIIVPNASESRSAQTRQKDTLSSLRGQTYARWTVLSTADEMAGVDFFGYIRAGDTLAAHALFVCVVAIAEWPDADIVYTDEDSLDQNGQRGQPFFKPDYGPESLLSRPYIGDLTLFRRTIAGDSADVFFEADLAAYDRVLHAVERARRIVHVPEIGYHRCSPRGALGEGAVAVVAAALERRGEHGVASLAPDASAVIVRYVLDHPGRVSIIMPTRDHGNDVDRALHSLFEKTTYADFDVFLVDNGSRDPSSLEIFEKWHARDSRVRILRYDVPFNYSLLNNQAARETNAPYLLLLNNDTEILTPDWLEAMLEQAQRPAIGAVGANLRFPDGSIQHAGVALGLGGVAGHTHRMIAAEAPGYFGALRAISNVSAVTGACLMVRRDVFEEAGGLDEQLTVAFNDIDFCLKLRVAGYRNVWLPHVVVRHFESLSRGQDVGLAKTRRSLVERDLMMERWSGVIANDPHYSPHLTRRDESISIRVES